MFPWCILRNIIQAENFRDKPLEQCTITEALKSCHCKCQWFEWLIIHTQHSNLTPPTTLFCKIYKSKREGLRLAAAGSSLGVISLGGGEVRSRGWVSLFLRVLLKKKKRRNNPLFPLWHLSCHNLGFFPMVLITCSITSLAITHSRYPLHYFLDIPGHMHIKKRFISTMVLSGYVRWTEMEPQCARHCARPWVWRGNKDKEPALTEFMVWMHDRYQRTLGTTGPIPIMLMMKKLKTRKEKWLAQGCTVR